MRTVRDILKTLNKRRKENGYKPVTEQALRRYMKVYDVPVRQVRYKCAVLVPDDTVKKIYEYYRVP